MNGGSTENTAILQESRRTRTTLRVRIGRGDWANQPFTPKFHPKPLAGRRTVTAPTYRGFGTLMIETLIKIDLAGELRFDWRAEGLVCEIELRI